MIFELLPLSNTNSNTDLPHLNVYKKWRNSWLFNNSLWKKSPNIVDSDSFKNALSVHEQLERQGYIFKENVAFETDININLSKCDENNTNNELNETNNEDTKLKTKITAKSLFKSALKNWFNTHHNTNVNNNNDNNKKDDIVMIPIIDMDDDNQSSDNIDMNIDNKVENTIKNENQTSTNYNNINININYMNKERDKNSNTDLNEYSITTIAEGYSALIQASILSMEDTTLHGIVFDINTINTNRFANDPICNCVEL